MKMESVFKYPLDNKELLIKRKKIKENLLPNSKSKIKVLLLSGSTIGELKDYIYLFLLNNGIEAEISEGTYGTYYEDILYGDIIEDVNPDWIYIHTTSKNILNFPKNDMSLDEVNEGFIQDIQRLENIISKLHGKNINVIINNFEFPLFRNFGSYDFVSEYGYINYINKLNQELLKIVTKYDNIYINDIMFTSSKVGLDNWYDHMYWHGFKYAVSPTALPYIGQSISSIINSVSGSIKKVLVCDLDNTLWGGVIGDDGINGVQVGKGNAKAEMFEELHSFILQLKKRGIVLAINSKNNIELAKEGFSNHGSLLSVDDFAAFVANWEPKSQNMNKIEEELNLLKDSFVFIDDNPAEIGQVSNVYPEIKCVSYDKTPIELIHEICFEGMFEVQCLSEEDRKRADLYKQRSSFNAKAVSALDFDQYLKSLMMKADITITSDDNLERCVQLINKTNQFNPTTFRVNKVDYAKRINECEVIDLCSELSDAYGKNGIVSVLLSVVVGDNVNIDAWVMSCRVFNRGLEYAMFDTFIELCREKGIKSINSCYIPSKKNGYVESLYTKLGFDIVNDASDRRDYTLLVSNYKKMNDNIEVKYNEQ